MSVSLLLQVEAVAEGAGWDNPSLLFLVTGSTQEPTFTPFAELTGHPCDLLVQMHDNGVSVEGAIGMALVAEGVRWRTFDELSIDLRADMLKDANDLEEAEAAWVALNAVNSPVAAAEVLTVRVRNAVLVTKAGWTLTVSRDRGQEPGTPQMISPTRLKLSRVPDFMHQFINGKKPTD